MRESKQVIPRRKTPDPECSLVDYFKCIGRIKPIPAEQQKKLFQRVRRGDLKARNMLVEANLPLAVFVAKKVYARTLRDVPLDDLVSEANLGLMRAVELFDPDRGICFSTYAYLACIHRVINLSHQRRVIKLPTYYLRDLSRYHRLRARLRRDPLVEEIARELKVSVIRAGQIQRMQKAADPITELLTDSPVLARVVPTDLDMADESSFWKNRAYWLLSILDPHSRDIVRLRFGMTGLEPLTYVHLARLLDCSKQRIEQIVKKSLKLMRAFAEEQGCTFPW